MIWCAMSGYKRATVAIRQDEYDRLKEAEQKLRALPSVDNNHLWEMQQQSQAVFNENLAQVQGRQEHFETLLSGVDGKLRDMELSTHQAVNECLTQATGAFESYAGALWEHLDDVLAVHDQAFQQVIAAHHRQQQEELSQLSRHIRHLNNEGERKRQLSEEWVSAAGQFCEFIRASYAHEFFAPGQVEKLENQLAMARQNLDQGLYEAGLMTAQQAYMAGSELRLDLEQRQSEWQFLFQAAWEAVTQLLDQANHCRVIPAVDLDGNLLPYEIDVDFWVVGRLTVFENELQDALNLLETGHELPDAKILQRWLMVDLPEYANALSEMILDARVNALNSQLRINIADLVVQALQEQGFALQGAAYEARDDRNSFEAQMMSLDGSEVLVQVAPVGSQLGENELHLQSLDDQVRTEHELRQRWQEVSHSLAQYGLEVGPAVTAHSSPAGRGVNMPFRPSRAGQRSPSVQRRSGRSHGY